MRRQLEATEARLSRALEAGFMRASDVERAGLLAQYLAETSVALRLLGLRLVQLHLDQGKSLLPELRDRVRSLLTARDPREQSMAVQTVASFREPPDADRFLSMLDNSTNRDVRVALLNGLGHVGTQAAVGPLIGVLNGADEAVATAAVSALGRLAERGMLPNAGREEVVSALVATFETTTPGNVALRERVLWAMANVADIKFAPAFTAALDRQETEAVRQAAVRGLIGLGNPQFADVLVNAASDPDTGVRKAAVEGLVSLGSGSNEKHVQALWDRVVSPLETEESVRQAAWRGVLDLLAKAGPDEVERWLARLPSAAPQDHQRAVELLEKLTKTAQDTDPVDHARLGRLRSRLAGLYGRLEQSQAAITAYLAALDSLSLAKSDGLSRASRDLLRYAIVSDRYDEQVAEALARVSPQAERPLLWQTVKNEIEPRLTPDGCEQALAMLALVERYPPGAWPHEIELELQQLRERAQQVKQALQPTSPGPATAPSVTAQVP
jgi:HEAT repeat protein